MTKQRNSKLNWLEHNLPEGLLVDARWLTRHGYSTSLRTQYVAAGWLKQPTRGVYCRPRGTLSWQQVVVSLQALLNYPLVVGGRTALELHGYAHYLSHELKEVHLYGSRRPPKWLSKLRVGPRFIYHNGQKLFREEAVRSSLPSLDWNPNKNDSVHDDLTVMPWGQWDWPLTLSSPERAILELLDELPKRETFHQADMLMDGLATLSPTRLQKLLKDCRSVKVKRLFFFFADRHSHAWLKRINKKTVTLGHGKRELAKGGKLNKAYQITVPEEMNAVS